MRQNLLETYSRQLKVAEAYVAKNFEGKTMSSNTALTTAVLLDNTNRWITESLNSEIGATTRDSMGAWKRFCLNLTNIAVPSLIANDLVIVHPMTSYSGSVAYLEYVSLTDKGDVKKGDVFNSVFKHGEMNEARQNFTSQIIVEKETEPTSFTYVAPKADGSEGDGNEVEYNGLSYTDGTTVKFATIKYIGKDAKGDKVVAYDVVPEGMTVDSVAYVAKQFQMNHIPATEIPAIGPRMKHIPLVAEPRRIAVRYDQITAFQAKTDYGFSLDKQIAEQACGELSYEIDTEIVAMLKDGAKEGTSADELAALTWSKTLPAGVSKFEHYNGFLEIVEMAKAIIYNRTKKFHPNYMVIASDILPVLRFVNGFTAVKNVKMNGPYKVGELDGMNVYVSPLMESGEFFLGLNGNDMMSSAGVYAPYMAIVPTQLLGTPDGGMAQGFSTWYAKALLNKNLLVRGRIVA
jgi:hypothetical protein